MKLFCNEVSEKKSLKESSLKHALVLKSTVADSRFSSIILDHLLVHCVFVWKFASICCLFISFFFLLWEPRRRKALRKSMAASLPKAQLTFSFVPAYSNL